MRFFKFIIFLIFFSSFSFSKTIVFGPEKYVRENGKPERVIKTFYVSNPGNDYELYVQNGDGKKEKSSCALIEINGETIVDPNEFNKNVDVIVKNISLKNQNEIAVEVRSEPNSYIIISIYGPDVLPSNLITDVKISPSEIFVNEQKYVTISAKINSDIIQYNPSVSLQRIDKYGNLISNEGNLFDNGNIENGDEIQGDGIYSMKKIFSSDLEQVIYLRICLSYNSSFFYSEKQKIYFLAPLTNEDIDIVKNVQEQAYQYYLNLIETMTPEEAMNEVLILLKQNPNILQADKTEDGFGIWFLYSSGILGAIDLTPEEFFCGPRNFF